MESAGDVTVLLGRLSKGDQGAADKVMPLIYDELRRIAARYMRQGAGRGRAADDRPGARGLPQAGRAASRRIGRAGAISSPLPPR